MNQSLVANIIFLTAIFLVSFVYWFSVNGKIKSYYRSYDYLFLTILVGFLLSRIFGILLDLNSYISPGVGLAPFMQSLDGEGIELSTTMPWSLLKFGDGNFFFSAFVFTPYITHLVFRNYIELRHEWRQQCYLFVQFGFVNLILISLFKIYYYDLNLLELNLETVELYLAGLLLVVGLLAERILIQRLGIIRFNRSSILILNAFGIFYIAYLVYKDFGAYIAGIIGFGILIYLNFYFFVKDDISRE